MGRVLAGAEVPAVRNGRRIRATVPARLGDRDLGIDPATATAVATATAEVARAAESLVVDLEPLATLLLRAEGVAAASIEGITAPAVDVALAEEHLRGERRDAAAWVAAALVATQEAIADAAGRAPLTLDTLCRWHRLLMAGAPTPEHDVGRLRDEPVRLGGRSALDAYPVATAPDRLEGLVADLLAWTDRDDVDPIVQAAVAHAQFAMVHPFTEGNGRLGRILVAWLLVRRLALVVPPPVSVAIAADTEGYGDGLVQFRQGDHLGWIRWFADAVTAGAVAQRSLVAAVDDIRAGWRARLADAGVRRDAAAHPTLGLLPRHLVLTSTVLVKKLGISHKAAVATLARLADLGILTEHGTVPATRRGRPARCYVSTELLGLTDTTAARS